MTAFDFTQEYILEDEAALLRPLQESDMAHLLPFSVNEPEIWTYSLLSAAGEDNLRTYIDTALLAKHKSKTAYPFIVFDKKQQAYAGSTRFYYTKLDNRTTNLGYTWYGKQFQGTGLNKHCKFLLLQFAFEHMDMLRVEFRADNNNARSIAAMKSIGCTVEGVLRNNESIPGGGRRDSIVLSILREEWFGGAMEALKKKLL
ncbi:MAG: GNAT family N-acetyltransferase [Saprospiraceae bacterium]